MGAKPAARSITGALRVIAFGAIALFVLLWVAIYNGYPTVYPDTGSYLLTSAFHTAYFPYRAPVYSKFIEWSGMGISAWYTVAMQALIVVFALYEACRFLIPGDAKFRGYCFLGMIGVLAIFSSLPWEASQLMPDVFAGTAFLAMFLLAFDGELRLLDKLLLAAILTVSVGAHMSLFPIGAAFAGALIVPRILGWRLPSAPTVKAMLAWLLVPVAAAGLWTATLNRSMGLGFTVSPSGNEFFLASLFGKGLVGDYLRTRCPTEPFAACRYLNNLPRTPEQFLFWSPIRHEMDGEGVEMRSLIRGTLEAYPLKFALYSTENTLQQIVENRTGDEIRAWDLHAPNSNSQDILQVFPADSDSFANDKQAQGAMSVFTEVISIVHLVVFWLAAIGCVYFARTAGDRRLNQFFFCAAIFLVINAAICATLAGVYERYQSRVAWLIPACLLFYMCDRIRARSASGAPGSESYS